MKLLLDENLSFRMVRSLADLFPQSAHVKDVGLAKADDQVIWEFAKANGFAILSKDDDFHQRSFLHGHPPKVVWLRLRNCSVDDAIAAVRKHHQAILDFDADAKASFLIIS